MREMSHETQDAPARDGPEVTQPDSAGEPISTIAGHEPGDFDAPPPPRRTFRSIYRTVLRRVRGYPSVEWMVKRGLRVGRDVYIGDTVAFDHGFLWLISIGDESVIASDTRIVAHDGSTKLWTGYLRVGRVDIGKRVYIGVRCIVLPGVRIGDESVIGAGSVVSRDIPERTVAAGNPAVAIATLDEFAARHRARLAARPCYPRAGFSAYDYVTPGNAERMRRELADGPGYVE
jgi:maltose O-acetyltransferase